MKVIIVLGDTDPVTSIRLRFLAATSPTGASPLPMDKTKVKDKFQDGRNEIGCPSGTGEVLDEVSRMQGSVEGETLSKRYLYPLGPSFQLKQDCCKTVFTYCLVIRKRR